MTLTYEPYTGFPIFNVATLMDIIGHVIELTDEVNDTSNNLKKYKQEVTKNREQIDNPGEIIGYIEYAIIIMEKYSIELRRLTKELNQSVKEQHVISFEQLCEDVIYNDKYNNKEFKREHIARDLKNEEFRPLLSNIYADTGNVLYSLRICADIGKRLKALVGAENTRYNQDEDSEIDIDESPLSPKNSDVLSEYAEFDNAVLKTARQHEKTQEISSPRYIATLHQHLYPWPVDKDFNKGGVDLDTLRKRVWRQLKKHGIRLNSKPGYGPEKYKKADLSE